MTYPASATMIVICAGIKRFPLMIIMNTILVLIITHIIILTQFKVHLEDQEFKQILLNQD